eukprot:5838006-Prorocentrum_lima.AAC.1
MDPRPVASPFASEISNGPTLCGLSRKPLVSSLLVASPFDLCRDQRPSMQVSTQLATCAQDG